MKSITKVGTVVLLIQHCLGNSPGIKGFVYDVYPGCFNTTESGVSVIFENGDFDGFSEKDQKQFLIYYNDSSLSYNFSNVMQLSEDFRNGYFNKVLEI